MRKKIRGGLKTHSPCLWDEEKTRKKERITEGIDMESGGKGRRLNFSEP
jgi:hypothetical protein